MAAPMCRGKILAVLCIKKLQVQHGRFPWTLKPAQFFRSSSSFSTFSLFHETTCNRTQQQATNMLHWRRNITSLDGSRKSCIPIGCCSFSSSSAPTNESEGSTRPHTGVKLPTTVKIKTLDTVGQRIRPGTIHLFDQEGNSMGAIHSYQALKRLNEPENSGLRLISIDPEAKPYAAYQLMTPQQLLEERAKLREEKKAQKGVGAVQSMRFSSDITKHDLTHKVHKIDGFIEKKSLVKISITNPRKSKKTTEDMVKLADNILKSLTSKATYQTPPTLKGTAVNCVLRPLSDKEASTGKKK
ncbi:translation initiation factor IF-3-like [Branchiostoma floridae x Branchiostoma japonicum]